MMWSCKCSPYVSKKINIKRLHIQCILIPNFKYFFTNELNLIIKYFFTNELNLIIKYFFTNELNLFFTNELNLIINLIKFNSLVKKYLKFGINILVHCMCNLNDLININYELYPNKNYPFLE
jgi:hypothetical protein